MHAYSEKSQKPNLISPAPVSVSEEIPSAVRGQRRARSLMMPWRKA